MARETSTTCLSTTCLSTTSPFNGRLPGRLHVLGTMSGALTSLTDALRRMDLSWEAHVEKTLQTSSTAQVEYCPSPGGILDPFEPDDNGALSLRSASASFVV